MIILANVNQLSVPRQPQTGRLGHAPDEPEQRGKAARSVRNVRIRVVYIQTGWLTASEAAEMGICQQFHPFR